MSKSFDVIIAGAGPVGLFLACELAAAGGVSVVVLERESSPESPLKDGHLGRRGLHLRAIEAFYRRGMLNKIFDGERKSYFEKTSSFQFAGHFAGLMIDGNNVDFSRWKYHLPGPSFLPGGTTLGRIETVLQERAQTLGVPVLRGMEVSKVIDEDEQVRVWAGDQCFEAKWLVGCDGGRSTVRRAAGFQFEGTEAEFTCYVAMCDLEKIEQLKQGFTHTPLGMYYVNGNQYVLVLDFDPTFDRSRPITREHLQAVLQRISDTDVIVKEVHFASSFTDRSKQVTEYRKGRIFLAGDSAHIHSALGAQGLNTGIADAINLGWKLAATVKGFATPGLLDTYHTERYPHAAWVLEWTRAQVVTLRPNPHVQATQKIIRDLLNTEDGATYFCDRIWGLSHRYELGDAHPLVGCTAPDFEFDDGLRLGTKLEKGGFWIVDFENNASVAKFAHALEPEVNYSGSNAKETLGFKALLVRPDGIVAWVSENEIDLDALKSALSRWVSLSEAN